MQDGRNKIVHLVKELRIRIRNLLPIEEVLLFFKEVGRLGDWIRDTKEFEIQINNLEILRNQAEESKMKSGSNLFNECMRVWTDIKKYGVLEKNLPDSTAGYFNYLDKVNESKVVYTLDFYYNLIHLIEGLALTKYKDIITPYYIQRIEDKTPLVGGKIYDFYMKLVEDETEFKKQQEDSVWGAWGMVNQIVIMYKGENRLRSLSDWAKVFKKQEYLVYLNKIADYFFDNQSALKIVESIPKTYEDIPANDLSSWPSMQIKEHVFLIENEEMPFHPEKSSSRQQSNRITDGEKIIELLIQSGERGLEERELCEKCEIDKRQIYSIRTKLSNRLRSSFNHYQVSIEKYGTKGKFSLCLFIIFTSHKDITLSE